MRIRSILGPMRFFHGVCFFLALAGGVSCASGASDGARAKSSVALEPVDASRFIQVSGTRYRAPDGSAWIGRGIAFGNAVWQNPKTASSFQHHRLSDYKRARDMGFNSVRFYLNYALFESDSKPGAYKDEGFAWIDQNIAAAREAGVGLILNMHFPQGGFQSNGNGDALWTNRKNQDRLVALWKEIARRYRAEPTVIGYGPVNEPVPVSGMDEWERLAQRLITAIREVDAHHIIFIERAIWLKSGTTPDVQERHFFPRVRDPSRQLALEFHFYEPMGFTHQNTSWTSWKGFYSTYPDESRVALADGRWAGLAEAGSPLSPGTYSWVETGGIPVMPDNPEWLIAYPVLQAQSLGTQGRVWLDGLKVEASSDGGTSYVTVGETDGASSAGWDFWSSDGSGSFSLSSASGSAPRRLCVTGTASDANITYRGFPIVMRPGMIYRAFARVRADSVSQGALVRLRLDYYSGKGLTAWNKRSLETIIGEYIAYANKEGLPLYLGEFGTAADSFRAGRGGITWVEDMLDILVKNGISYNYHTWRESPFGIHQHDDGYADPARMNLPLVEAFRRLQ